MSEPDEILAFKGIKVEFSTKLGSDEPEIILVNPEKSEEAAEFFGNLVNFSVED